MIRRQALSEPRPWRARRDGRPGQSLVEFALVLPLLLLLVVTIIDFGRAFYVQTALQNGAREGARFGSVRPTWVTSTNHANPDNVLYRTSSEPATTVNSLTITVSCITPGNVTYLSTDTANYTACAKSGSRIDVRVSTQFTLLTPIIGMFSGGLQLAGETRMTIE